MFLPCGSIYSWTGLLFDFSFPEQVTCMSCTSGFPVGKSLLLNLLGFSAWQNYMYFGPGMETLCFAGLVTKSYVVILLHFATCP